MPELDSNRSGHLAIVAPSAYLLGGVQTWLDYLVPGLEAAGWTVTVLLAHGDHSDADGYLRSHPFPRVRRLENPTGSREGRVRALGAAIRDVDPELVLVVNIVDAYEAVARLRRKGAGPKIAMALHAQNSAYFDDMSQWADVLDGVVATNRLGAAAAEALERVPPERVHYAPCGVMVPPFAEHSTHGDTKVNLLYAGRFDATEKRVLDLPPILHALRRSGVDFALKLAGAGPAESGLRSQLLEFGDQVEFLGMLGDVDLQASFFSPGDVALVLSPSETGPLFAWEAMANSVPLVSSRFVGIGLEGGLRDGVNCLCFPVGDTGAAAKAIMRMSDPALRRSLAKAAHEMVLSRYTRAASVREWDVALRSIRQQDPLPTCSPREKTPATGRLDRLLGASTAEVLRRQLGLRFRHEGPGGEWPHSYGSDDESFRLFLADLDQPRQVAGIGT